MLPCCARSKTPEGDIYYFNFESGESIWDHPCDKHYRCEAHHQQQQQRQQERQQHKRTRRLPAGVPHAACKACSCLPRAHPGRSKLYQDEKAKWLKSKQEAQHALAPKKAPAGGKDLSSSLEQSSGKQGLSSSTSFAFKDGAQQQPQQQQQQQAKKSNDVSHSLTFRPSCSRVGQGQRPLGPLWGPAFSC